ncbi:E3 ubiquitin-protein ligase TRIM58 [Octodon degus]|uniref:E3 ubiquitin-protein ligase TRIM58 n=1 Tax=Octodon degus TaxID=10160 RepID=A0A6P3FWK9_OCTDE|nr:E3 ubiquitin-protein ligase TRIM58 [Octodon degus]
MASGPGARLQEDASCAVCLDLLRAPVSVDCGHSFCAACVHALLDAPGRSEAPCPQCRAAFRPEGVRPNRQLAALVDGVRRLVLAEGSAEDAGVVERCALHGQELALFCLQDGHALCRACAAGEEHRGHRTAELQEAVEEHRVKLQLALEAVRKEAEEAAEQEVTVGKKIVVWKEKMEVQRHRFRLEFEKHRGFLALEEQLQLRRLEEEERATLHRLRDSRVQMAQHSKALKELVEELEQRSQRPALRLLEGVREVLSRSKAAARLEPEAIPLELRTVCHIPGMRDMMRRFQVDVTLDPTTAHPSLLLTADLRSVWDGALWRDVPGNPERFDTWPCVLGLQSFSTGRHYWEVEVGSRAEWGLGVCRDSLPRQGETTPSPENGVWALWLLRGSEYMVLGVQSAPLLQLSRPGHVGLFLDYEAGELSFYDVTHECHIYTFSQLFSGFLRPYFFICDKNPLLLPAVTEAESGSGASGAAPDPDGPEMSS